MSKQTVTFTLAAPEHTRYTPGAFAKQVGKQLPINVLGASVGGTLTAAVVSQDGSQVELTIEVVDQGLVPPTFYDHPRWGCGCDGTGCELRMDVGQDAGSDPSQTIRVICKTHGIYGDSDQAKVSGSSALQLRQQAMQRLDLAHQEQCR